MWAGVSHQPGGENSATGRFLWAVGRQTGVPVAARNEAPPTPTLNLEIENFLYTRSRRDF